MAKDSFGDSLWKHPAILLGLGFLFVAVLIAAVYENARAWHESDAEIVHATVLNIQNNASLIGGQAKIRMRLKFDDGSTRVLQPFYNHIGACRIGSRIAVEKRGDRYAVKQADCQKPPNDA